jgi:hypothetical protein
MKFKDSQIQEIHELKKITWKILLIIKYMWKLQLWYLLIYLISMAFGPFDLHDSQNTRPEKTLNGSVPATNYVCINSLGFQLRSNVRSKRIESREM